ncbi:glycosyltransferase family 2 protein [Chitinophaga alhagiae]|uniref:glycosyltransferase family 2 protein n=1 Tax=Chitinophaga alhagiae TaxID=2203219 RepID=UPI000E5C2965|nr:glycosyltransferase family 2 protein [Chitinophaga alhagiae]
MKKIISVVVPVYNGEAYIKDTLDSLRRQTFRDFELIVVDGASTDNTLQIVQSHPQAADLVISEKDEGMYDALRKGMAAAGGRYLCYINADDRLLPYTLEKVVRKFEKGGYDLVFGDVNYISETGAVAYTYKGVNLGWKAISHLRRVPFAQQSAFWTREIYERAGGFDKSMKYSADSKFLLSICLNPAVKKGYIPAPLGEYRMHGGSFSISVTDKMISEHHRMTASLPLTNSKLGRYFYEMVTKLVNARGIYRKMTYKGTKF